MAPANASRPPTIHVARKGIAAGTDAAICGGVNRMPPPMTLETMIAAASSGPRRRSSVATLSRWCCGEQLPLDRELAHLRPGARAVFAEHLYFDIDESTIREDLRPRLVGAGVAQIAAQDDLFGVRLRRQAFRADGRCKVLTPRLRL